MITKISLKNKFKWYGCEKKQNRLFDLDKEKQNRPFEVVILLFLDSRIPALFLLVNYAT